MQWNRYCSRSINCDAHDVEVRKLPASLIDHLMRRINSIRGFKRATASCISRVRVGHIYNGKIAADVYYSQNGKDGVINLR